MLRSIDLHRQSGLSHQSLGSAVSIGTTFGWHNRYTQLLEHIDDLLLAEPSLAHSSVSFRRILASKRGCSRGQGHFETCSYIYSVAENVAVLYNNIGQIDSPLDRLYSPVQNLRRPRNLTQKRGIPEFCDKVRDVNLDDGHPSVIGELDQRSSAEAGGPVAVCKAQTIY